MRIASSTVNTLTLRNNISSVDEVAILKKYSTVTYFHACNVDFEHVFAYG